jgi:hypothetical protein
VYQNGPANFPSWLREEFLRPDAAAWKHLYIQEWPIGSVVSGLSDSRSSRSVVAPVRAAVLFIGGPWDGRRQVIDSLPSRFYVEQLQKISQEVSTETGQAPDGPVTTDKVMYAKVDFGGKTFYVAMPPDRYGSWPITYAAEELFKGYKNLA